MDIKCVSLEVKRDEFRKYLESTGTAEKLTDAMMKLYQEVERPEDSLNYITLSLREACPDTEAVTALREEIGRIKLEKAKLKVELSVAKSQIKKTPSEMISILKTLFKALDDDENATCLLKNT